MNKFVKIVVILFTHSFLTIYSEPNLLIKIPTSSRPNQFFSNLDKFYQNLSGEISYKFLISCDIDDKTMNNIATIEKLKSYPNLEFNFSANKSTVEAFNADIIKYKFDILLIASDDMEPIVKGFDKIIVGRMKENFPEYDGILNFKGNGVNYNTNVYPIIGRKFYEFFGYVYNPEYKTLTSNLELTLVSKILKKEKIINQVIIKSPKKNYKQEIEVFNKRRSQFFGLSEDLLLKPTPKLWSILICTIEGREKCFNKLSQKLKEQSKMMGVEDQVEILACKDKRGDSTVGFKRNKLLEESCGKYVSFIDDDDDIHDEFIKLVYEKLQKNPDCVSLTGIIHTARCSAKFVHSLRYISYFYANNIFYRPPNHLNPMKRAIAIQFGFVEKNFGEDREWAIEVTRSQLLKKEEKIDIPYYFYLCYDEK